MLLGDSEKNITRHRCHRQQGRRCWCIAFLQTHQSWLNNSCCSAVCHFKSLLSPDQHLKEYLSLDHATILTLQISKSTALQIQLCLQLLVKKKSEMFPSVIKDISFNLRNNGTQYESTVCMHSSAAEHRCKCAAICWTTVPLQFARPVLNEYVYIRTNNSILN